MTLPLGVLYDVVEDVRERCRELTTCSVGYGHIGDGVYTCVCVDSQ